MSATGLWAGNRAVIRPRLLAWLRKQSEPRTAPDIAAAVGCHPRSVHYALRQLRAMGKVEPAGRLDSETHGPSFRLWRAK